jgi:hypothetical protein
MSRTTNSVASRIVVAIFGIVLTAAGTALLWFGGGQQIVSATHGSGPRISVLGITFAVVGMVLMLAVTVTARVTSVGVALAGIAVAAFGIVVLVSQDTSLSIILFFRPISAPLVVGSGLWMLHGLVFALGIVLVAVAAVASLSRIPPVRSKTARMRGPIAVVLAIVTAVIGLDFLSSRDLQHIVIGAALLGVVVLTGTVSRSALIITGLALTIAGVLGFLFQPAARSMAHLVGFIGEGAASGLQTAFGVGFVATFGAILLATAVVVGALRAHAVAVVLQGDVLDTVDTGEH